MLKRIAIGAIAGVIIFAGCGSDTKTVYVPAPAANDAADPCDPETARIVISAFLEDSPETGEAIDDGIDAMGEDATEEIFIASFTEDGDFTHAQAVCAWRELLRQLGR